MEDPLLGQQLGNYVIRSLIGRGGMGAVYLAEHPEIGRRVAVKVLAPELSHVQGLSDRFVSEARAASRIEHENVIAVLDFGRSPAGQLYQVMELLRGRDLAQVMKERGPMPVAEVVPYVEQLCDGLGAAHAQSVVHRDLKPENIFVLDRQPLALKILDFGIARLLDPGAQAPLTMPGIVLGSPLTMAPEQAAGQRDAISPRTDLYSLGVIIYWLLAGRPPFTDGTTALLLVRHMGDPPPPLTGLAPGVAAGVAAVVHRCLEKDPERRPASARELREAFLAAAREVPATVVAPAHPTIPATIVAPAKEAAPAVLEPVPTPVPAPLPERPRTIVAPRAPVIAEALPPLKASEPRIARHPTALALGFLSVFCAVVAHACYRSMGTLHALAAQAGEGLEALVPQHRAMLLDFADNLGACVLAALAAVLAWRRHRQARAAAICALLAVAATIGVALAVGQPTGDVELLFKGVGVALAGWGVVRSA